MYRQTIAVYGATGHAGKFVVGELVRRGHPVVPVGRNPPPPSGTPMEWRVAACDDPDALNEALRETCAAGHQLSKAIPQHCACLGRSGTQGGRSLFRHHRLATLDSAPISHALTQCVLIDQYRTAPFMTDVRFETILRQLSMSHLLSKPAMASCVGRRHDTASDWSPDIVNHWPDNANELRCNLISDFWRT